MHNTTFMTIDSSLSVEYTQRLDNSTSDELNIMDKLLRESSRFLFPFMIEYSLICAVFLYVMWKNIADNNEHYTSQRPGRNLDHTMNENSDDPYVKKLSLEEGDAGQQPQHHK